MKDALAAIDQRVSVRSYDGKPLLPGERARVREILEGEHRGPFGHPIRFALLDQEGGFDAKRFGTYGFIKDPRAFIVGAAPRAPGAAVDYGYALERVVLELTEAGLGTCWLGGTFTRSAFAQAIDLAPEEILPCITPVGHGVARSLRERLVRFAAGSHARKPWEELFFDGNPGLPLLPEKAGDWAPCLEAVRRGPSASNRQPWRVLRIAGEFHFMLARNRLYDSAVREASLQETDLGIALSHFELAARQGGRPGGWRLDAPGLLSPPWEYIATWATA
ncbi:MAG: nitroreductase family protein [Spirochaetes bacterium]|nr:nitroreductase family protein [Spirochaetota bacterium]